MKYIKLELGKKTVTQKLAQGNTIKDGMTNNLDFPAPAPTLAALGNAMAALATRQTTRDNLLAQTKAATLDLHAAEKSYDETITQLGQYAEATAMGDTKKLEKAGFIVRNPPAPLPALGQVEDLKLMSNTHTNMLLARWKPLRGAKSYEVRTCLDPVSDAGWKLLKASPASSTVIDGLTSGTKIWVQVRGVAKKTSGAWSQPACRVVP